MVLGSTQGNALVDLVDPLYNLYLLLPAGDVISQLSSGMGWDEWAIAATSLHWRRCAHHSGGPADRWGDWPPVRQLFLLVLSENLLRRGEDIGRGTGSDGWQRPYGDVVDPDGVVDGFVCLQSKCSGDSKAAVDFIVEAERMLAFMQEVYLRNQDWILHGCSPRTPPHGHITAASGLVRNIFTLLHIETIHF